MELVEYLPRCGHPLAYCTGVLRRGDSISVEYSLQANVNAPRWVSPHCGEVIKESGAGGQQCCLWSCLQCVTGFEISKILDKYFYFFPEVPAFVSVIAVKRCVKKLLS